MALAGGAGCRHPRVREPGGGGHGDAGPGASLVVLVDEHGGTSGILSGDDVLGRLLGQWHGGVRQQAGERVRSLPNGNLLLDGLALVADLEDVAAIELEGAGEDFDTVSGFVMERRDGFPPWASVRGAGYEFQ